MEGEIWGGGDGKCKSVKKRAAKIKMERET